jgi:hypothetical protein
MVARLASSRDGAESSKPSRIVSRSGGVAAAIVVSRSHVALCAPGRVEGPNCRRPDGRGAPHREADRTAPLPQAGRQLVPRNHRAVRVGQVHAPPLPCRGAGAAVRRGHARHGALDRWSPKARGPSVGHLPQDVQLSMAPWPRTLRTSVRQVDPQAVVAACVGFAARVHSLWRCISLKLAHLPHCLFRRRQVHPESCRTELRKDRLVGRRGNGKTGAWVGLP